MTYSYCQDIIPQHTQFQDDQGRTFDNLPAWLEHRSREGWELAGGPVPIAIGQGMLSTGPPQAGWLLVFKRHVKEALLDSSPFGEIDLKRAEG